MKESKFFIDTNIFLRVLTRDIERSFQDSLRFLERVNNGEFKAITSNLVLTEAQWTLLGFYGFPKKKTIEGLRSILQLKNLKIIDKCNTQNALDLYETKPVKFVDTLIASYVLLEKTRPIVISYDKEFDKLGVLRKEPHQV